MRIKDLILLPAVVVGLTAASTSCYGGSANDRNNNNNDNGIGINNRQAPNPNGNGSIPTTSSTYSSSTYSNTTNTKVPAPANGTATGTQAPGRGCSTTDLSVFEEADEENVYGDHGFTRGDIKNLYVTKYDPKSEQTINGNVQKILRVQFPDGNCYFVAVVQISGAILVNLGPVWYADENNMVINEGDQVQVVGSLIRTNGRYILIASQVKKDGQSLQLRNQSGSPQWGSPKSQKGTTFAGQ